MALSVPGLNRTLSAKHLWPYLQRCGYRESTVLKDVSLPGNRMAAYAGFAHRPFDMRSACFVALDVTSDPESDARACRDVGAPITFLCHEDRLLWWSQTEKGPFEVEPVSANRLEGFFRERAADFSPSTVYRAKSLGRFEASYQREFVDLGLLPMVEREAGQTIERLLLDSVAQLRVALGWPKNVDLKQGQWLVKSVFWLLGAKMLHDKEVEGFVRLNFGDAGEVFSRVARHYGESAEDLVSSQAKRRALDAVSARISAGADLRLATTEALAYVYENTLISDEVRAEFGTHSTPSFLVDYMVGRLAPWIADIDQSKRSVFEPACGHGAFLVSAIRTLTSLLPPAMAEPEARKRYLRDRVRGYDVDEFAVEIARLSLTLTDIPNANGWMIKAADLFESDHLESAAKESTILLANPPFEDFKRAQRAVLARSFREPRFLNKAAEILYRSLSAMPAGGLFAVVVPQPLLHESASTPLRKLMLEHFELQEVCLFSDKVFTFADQESAALIGRKHGGVGRSGAKVRYRRVRERQIDQFRTHYAATNEEVVDLTKLSRADDFDLRVPDLQNVWEACRKLPRWHDIAEIGQGFVHLSPTDIRFPAGAVLISDEEFEGAVRGFVTVGSTLLTHQLPKGKWVNIAAEVLRRPQSGAVVGLPQVLMNYSPAQRAPWCIKAVADRNGHAASSRFLVIRPRSDSLPIEVIWAIFNSPFANAYAYAHSSKRDILAGTMRGMPAPDLGSTDLSILHGLVRRYFDALAERKKAFALRSDSAEDKEVEWFRLLHWRIDAEVLRLYALPKKIEKELLDYFSDWIRVGVPFPQDRFLPQGINEPISLGEFLTISADWNETNERRLELIDKKAAKSITSDELTELIELQRLAGLKRELHSSPSLAELAKTETDLRKRGLWRGE